MTDDLRILRKRTRAPAYPAQEEWSFWCPGCKCGHAFVVKWDPGLAEKMREDKLGTPTWTFNGDQAKPTFGPSLLYREEYEGKVQRVCHLYVKAGQIEFLGDCTHELRGKTVPMEPF